MNPLGCLCSGRYPINLLCMMHPIPTHGTVGQTMCTWNGGTLPLHFIEFDPASFDLTAYERHAIACPPHVARSVLQRQADYFFGRLAAREALTALGLCRSEVGTGDSREPVWPPGVLGSISHNERYAVAVAADAGANGGIGIGIDIESIPTAALLAALRQTVLSRRELDYLSKADTNLPLAILTTLIFSAKESFYKASFKAVGRFFDFDAIELIHIDPSHKAISFRIRETLARALPGGAIRTVHYRMVGQRSIFTSCNLPPGE